MDFLTQNKARIDFAKKLVRLNGSNSMTLQASKEQHRCTLSKTVVQSMQAFQNIDENNNIFAISAKQAKRLLRDNQNCKFLAVVREDNSSMRSDTSNLASTLNQQTATQHNSVKEQLQLGIDGDNNNIVASFISKHMHNCDEFVDNVIHCRGTSAQPHLKNTRNLLLLDSQIGRDAHARMYQRTDMYLSTNNVDKQKHPRAQIYAGNTIYVTTMKQLEDLINLPNTLLCYNVFVVPANMLSQVRQRLSRTLTCLANVITVDVVSTEVASMLKECVNNVLHTGSPIEYFLSKCYANDSLPDGAIKHLLSVDNTDTQQQLKSLLKDFADVCPNELPQQVPPSRNIDDVHHIQLQPDAKPVSLPPYRQSPAQQDLIRTQIDELLASGCIRPSKSEFASPVLLIRKPDGSIRFCVDYRQLNKITVRDKFPLPRADDLIDALVGSTVFSSLDLRSGYWQLRMHEESVDKTAFVTQQGQWEWLVLPFGLTNAPSSFQRVMNNALGDLTNKFVKVYLDDIIIHSSNVADHMQHLRIVLERLRKYKFFLKLRKCKFLQSRITFLGHDIDANGVHISKDKVLAVTNWPTPTNVSEVRTFLGFIQFFRRSLPNLAHMSLPLTTLTQKNALWKWTEHEQSSFDQIKQSVVSAPCMRLVDYSDPNIKLELHTDASQFALGSVLLVCDANEMYPVAYHSRKFSPTECNYSTTDREMLAIVDSLRHFRYCLLGREFRVCTDHKPLIYYFGKSKQLSSREANWQARLCEFQPGMHLVYVPGASNVLADGLSRRPDFGPAEHSVPLSLQQSNLQTDLDVLVADCYESLLRGRPVQDVHCPACQVVLPPDILLYPGRQVKERKQKCTCGQVISFSSFNSPLGRYCPVLRTVDGATGIFLTIKGQPPACSLSPLDAGLELQLGAMGLSAPVWDVTAELQPLQEADPLLRPLRQKAQGSDPCYRLRDGVLYRVGSSGDRVVVPASLQPQLISEYHDHTGHLGVSRTLDRLAQRFWFPAMQQRVQEYVRQCDTCQRTKVDNTKPRGLLQPISMSSEPWRDIAMDFLTELPTHDSTSTLLVVVDRFSKMIRLVPLGEQTDSSSVAKAFFSNVVKIHGLPKSIISDRDSRFQSDLWTKLMTEHMGTTLKFSTAYHPQTDGQSERTIRSVLQMLRSFVHDHPQDWLQYLPMVELFYNSTKQGSVGKSPHEIVFGQNALLPVDLTVPVNQAVKSFVELWSEAKVSIEKAQNAQKLYADKFRTDEKFEVGDFVLLNSKTLPLRMSGSRKLMPLWIGPYKVSTVIGDNAYALDLPSSLRKLHPVFNVGKLKRYHGRVIPPPDPVEIQGHDEYEVEAIVAHRRVGRRKRTLQYLVRFVGYDAGSNEWLPENHLAGAMDILSEYKSRNKL